MKALGMRGVMMPGNPAVEDYDSPIYDDFWAGVRRPRRWCRRSTS